MFEKIAPYRKAVIAFLAPGILVLCTPLLAGRAPTVSDWLVALGTALATSLSVYAVPNTTVTDGGE